MSGMILGQTIENEERVAVLIDISKGKQEGEEINYVDVRLAKKEGGEINSGSFVNIAWED